MSKIFPTRIRPQGAWFAIWNQQAATIVVLVAGPIALERIAWKFFLVLIIPTALYIPVIYFCFRRRRSVRSKISMHSLGRWLRLSLVRPKQLFSIGKRHKVMKNEERAEALLFTALDSNTRLLYREWEFFSLGQHPDVSRINPLN